VSPDEVDDDASIAPGFLYEISPGVDDVTLTMGSHTLAEITSKRIAVKAVGGTEGGPGDVIVVVPGGMTIEDESGTFGSSTTIANGRQAPVYREWFCTPDGGWLLVTPPVTGFLAAAATYEDGGPEEISVDGLSGVLANAQPIAVAKGGVLVGVELLLNLIEGYRTKITAADDGTGHKIDVTLAQLVADAATAFAWVSNAASIDVSVVRHFAASNTLTGNSTLTLASGVDGCRGKIYVKQDGTGGRTLTFSVSGRIVLKDLNVADTNPLVTANSYTVYEYSYETIAGTAVVVLLKGFLQ
jgi:hypothetical protein